MKSKEAGDGAATLDDLLAQLDATSAAGREADEIRADRDPRIPKLEHVLSYEWRPPPSREEVLKTVSADCCRRFNRTTRNNGEHFRKEGILRHPKDFNIWEVHRIVNAVPQRSIGNPRGRHGLARYHAQSEPFEEPTEKQLHAQHRDWLKQHHVQRDKRLHHVYHALKAVEKAEAKANETQRQRETARDLLTRAALHEPHLTDSVKGKLNRAKLAVGATRAFNKLSGIDGVAEEEQKNKDLLERARSAPILQLKPSTPRHRARHLRNWTGPDRRQRWTQTDLGLKHTTPGLAKEEEHELHNSPRYRARGA
jgi:hypothetical protein